MSPEISSEVQQSRRARINASSTALSLWLCLLVFQVVRFAWFVFLLRTDGIVSYMIICVPFSLIIEAMIFRWIGVIHGYIPAPELPFTVIPGAATQTNWNPLRWNLHANGSVICYLAIGMPAFWFVQFWQPGRLLCDGPCVGPLAMSELRLPTAAGVLEFSDGNVRHALGGAVDTGRAGVVVETFYADPYGDDTWDQSQPVQVWVVHEKGEEITAEHRYAYVITKQDAHRVTYKKAVENSNQRFQTRSAEHAIMVRLDTRQPAWPNGPTYLQVLGAFYLLSGLYVGVYVRRLALLAA